ncbi:MAG TPA: phosphatase PAP2 family protein [Ilumatobacteraceae bacterium]|nr:phosphatase PAP2 family protein [Ilumatobacteraceae bacterium]
MSVNERAPSLLEEPERDPTSAARRPALWREAMICYAFYYAYTRIRGKSRGTALESLRNARRLINWERTLNVYHEHTLQRLVLSSDQIVIALNYFYGTAHFLVTPGVAIYLARCHPASYRVWRNVLAWTTGLALIGYYLFPLMPPRLVPGLRFTDTMVTHPNAWKLTPIPIWNIGNPYAAMPSLHVAWALWVCFALLAHVERPAVRLVAYAYPLLTVIALVGTGNHYVLDAVGGALVFAVGYKLAPATTGALARAGARVSPARTC